MKRCAWVDAAGDKQFYVDYHDQEWGTPVHDDNKHFEMLILEGAQAGLSWVTILQRRDGYRRAFKNFDPKKVARMTDDELEKLLLDEGIIRNRLKVWSARTNAQVFLDIVKEFGSFDNYVWRFVDGKTVVNRRGSNAPPVASTPQSDALSKDLKKRGMKFVGTTIMYAYMQAVGLVDDHVRTCFRYGKAATASS